MITWINHPIENVLLVCIGRKEKEVYYLKIVATLTGWKEKLRLSGKCYINNSSMLLKQSDDCLSPLSASGGYLLWSSKLMIMFQHLKKIQRRTFKMLLKYEAFYLKFNKYEKLLVWFKQGVNLWCLLKMASCS